MQVGFLIDRLSALMMAVVTFVSLCVHVYTVGYMRDDPGYQRFFSYISLFTFGMLMLVMATTSCSCSSAGKRSAWCPTC
jgi:NADH-quinone oxidoreductase subunit L